MAQNSYDIITVGGGLGGSALAKVMAAAGARVLVVERETQFRDRVRGEYIEQWGIAEARKLGIYEMFRAAGHEIPSFDTYIGSMPLGRRDCVATTSHHAPTLGIFHPALQQSLIDAAAEAGAEVRRGATVSSLKPGPLPSVVVDHAGRREEISARLVVGVDGRSSAVRKWAGFEVKREPDRLYIAGLLFDPIPAPQETSVAIFNPFVSQIAYLFPQGGKRVRAYVVYHIDSPWRLQGDGEVSRFIDEAIRTGMPPEFLAGATPAGPLASFITADHWVDHPYRDGVALLGDAAASSDPIWGQGLSLTMRDVRVLRDCLLADSNWDAACHAYAEAHDHHFGVIHTAENWLREMWLGRGAEADARRARALPLLAQDPSRMPDHLFGGPDLPADESVRRRFFAED
jgi:2-polyprenyl-6-methoxyphenol hydroxylase-like FAD-dependent oxidoreductase